LKNTLATAAPFAVLALWIAYFWRTGFTLEGTLAFIAFYMLVVLIFMLAKGSIIMLEFLRLSQMAYDNFKKK
jgi:hypothetical protein